MGRCRPPVNRLVMMRKKGLCGPAFQNIGVGCMKSVGNFIEQGGGGGPVTPVFYAATFDPTTYEMLLQRTGVGTPTSTHTADLYCADVDGVYQKFPANAPVWAGARCVLSGGPGTDVVAAYADDGVGALLPVQPWLQYYPAATNSVHYSNDQTNVAYSGNEHATRDLVGLTGVPDTSCTLATTSTVSSNPVTQYITVPSDTNPNTLKVWVKVEDDETTFPGVVYGTVSSNYWLRTQINKKTGDLITVNSGGSPVFSRTSYRDGDWWVVCVELINSLYTTFEVWLEGANGNVWGSELATATGSVGIGNVELHHNKTIAQVRGLGPIFTEGTAVSTDAVNPTYDAANHDDTAGAYYLDVDYTGADKDLLTVDGNMLTISGGNLILSDGTNTTQAAIAVGEHKVGISYGSSLMDLNLNGAWAGEVAYDGSFGTSAIIQGETAREIQRINPTSYDEGKAWVDEQMENVTHGGWPVTHNGIQVTHT